MAKFLDQEKLRLTTFKRNSPYFSPEVRADGVYKGRQRPFCLPRAHAVENLFPGIRERCPAYFAAHGIKWHDGVDGGPSNHLCDSQVCCANFLSPFAGEPEALAALLQPLFPALQRMLPVEDGAFVAFEWIGAQNYLGERMPRHGRRTRGANVTSTDAAVRFQRDDGTTQFVLIEWKYTESYNSSSHRVSRSGTDRTAIYRHLYERPDFPLRKELLPDFGALFYEPLYQLFRQQALAHEMERAGELEADIVSVLHIAAAHNRDFLRVTSPELRHLGDSVLDVWKRLVKRPGRFMSVETEHLFGGFDVEAFPGLRGWWEYVAERYAWVSSRG